MNRRSLMGWAVRLPIFGVLAKWVVVGDNSSSAGTLPPEEDAARSLAIRLLRFINTAQRAQLDATGQFAELGSLWTSAHAEKALDDKRAEKMGISRHLYSSLDLGADEIAPGLRLQFKLGADARCYVAVVECAARTGGTRALATDQDARIFEGASVAALVAGELRSGAEMVSDARPMRISAPSRRAGLSKLFRMVAVGPVALRAGTVHAGCGCELENYCCCYLFEDCYTHWTTGCYNCGCETCIWCCMNW